MDVPKYCACVPVFGAQHYKVIRFVRKDLKKCPERDEILTRTADNGEERSVF